MSTALAEKPQTGLDRWMVDPRLTTVEFEVPHLWGLHTVHGRFTRFGGSYVDGPTGPEIELAIDASSVDTHNATRDEHLRSWDFFDVVSNPQVRFTSTEVTGLGKGRVHVRGDLEAAGAVADLEFDATVRSIGGDLEIEATTTVDQRRFGMSAGPLGNIRQPAKLLVRARLVREPSA